MCLCLLVLKLCLLVLSLCSLKSSLGSVCSLTSLQNLWYLTRCPRSNTLEFRIVWILKSKFGNLSLSCINSPQNRWSLFENAKQSKTSKNSSCLLMLSPCLLVLSLCLHARPVLSPPNPIVGRCHFPSYIFCKSMISGWKCPTWKQLDVWNLGILKSNGRKGVPFFAEFLYTHCDLELKNVKFPKVFVIAQACSCSACACSCSFLCPCFQLVFAPQNPVLGRYHAPSQMCSAKNIC